MLAEIYVENIALVTKFRLNFDQGFTVLTGETGAGKSILLDAMALLIGAKADTTLIRHGAQKAIVEGVFTHLSEDIHAKMEHYGLEGEELILMREISFSRNICRINGRTFPLGVLREFGERLINIYGQHDFQTLLSTDKHLVLLDAFKPDILSIKKQVQVVAQQILKLSKEIEHIKLTAQQTAKEADFLAYQAKEIDDANLLPNEEEELIVRQKFLANAEKIITALSTVYNNLYGGLKETASEIVAEAAKNLNLVSECSEELQNFSQNVWDISAQLDDVALEIKSYLDNLEYNPKELEEIDERLYLIKTLKKKYGSSIMEILNYRNDIKNKLNLLTNQTENEAKLLQQLEEFKMQYQLFADQLTSLRKQAAKELSDKINAELHEMNMSADLQVSFTLTEDFNANGKETAEFFIRTNVGDTFKPLAKIASGGELARLMLALRTVLNAAEPVKTLVFDEVDAGMGGYTLTKVALKLKALAKEAQVFCVTHSAQLAAKAQNHYLVQKTESNDQTITNVTLLDEQQRVAEIARMLDGQISNLSIGHAEELLKM